MPLSTPMAELLFFRRFDPHILSDPFMIEALAAKWLSPVANQWSTTTDTEAFL